MNYNLLTPHKGLVHHADALLGAVQKMITGVGIAVSSTNLWPPEYEDLSKMDQNAVKIQEAQADTHMMSDLLNLVEC